MISRIPAGIALAISTCFVACSCITGGTLHDEEAMKEKLPENGVLVSNPATGADPSNSPKGGPIKDTPNSNQNPSPNAKPRVMPDWQSKMDELLASKPAGTEAFGLFSYGGWANAGQFMVFLSADKASGQLVLVEPSSKKINKERKLTEVELKRIVAKLAGISAMTDYIPEGAVFDALEYEIVHARKDESGGPFVLKRIYMQSPGGADKKASVPHLSLVRAFEELRTIEN